MLKIYSIFSENFRNAVQIAYTLHAELNRPAKIAVKNHVRDDPRHPFVTYIVSEIETQCWQRD